MHRSFASYLALFSAITPLRAASAQPADLASQLREPATTLAHEFTWITSIRELRDGRVLIVDRGERTLHVADFTPGHLTTVGRQGGGPGDTFSRRRFAAMPPPHERTLLTWC